MNQEDISGNPNMQLGGLLAPWPSDDGVQIVEEVLSHRVEDGRVFLDCWTSGGEWATVVLTPVNEYVFRLTLYPSGAPQDAARDAVPGGPGPDAPSRSSRMGTATESGLKIDAVRSGWEDRRRFRPTCVVEITKKPCELVVKNRYGFPILREHRADTNLRGWRRASWLGYRRGPDGSVAATFDALALAPDEHIYGLGEKFMPLDRRGQRIESWNYNTWGATNERAYKNVPFFVSSQRLRRLPEHHVQDHLGHRQRRDLVDLDPDRDRRTTGSTCSSSTARASQTS